MPLKYLLLYELCDAAKYVGQDNHRSRVPITGVNFLRCASVICRFADCSLRIESIYFDAQQQHTHTHNVREVGHTLFSLSVAYDLCHKSSSFLGIKELCIQLSRSVCVPVRILLELCIRMQTMDSVQFED